MSKKSLGFKVRLGFDNVESIMTLLNLVFTKINKALEGKDITSEHNFSGIEIVDNQDFSYTIMFNFDDELSIDEILDKAITGVANEK